LDFKLKNAILIKSQKNTKKLAVKLIDFGASRRTRSDKNLEEISESINLENKIFTKMYVSPEVIRSNEVDARILSDI
jgi:serine/threonine protein kinase